jgi:SSS family solute:Na+ symporter
VTDHPYLSWIDFAVLGAYLLGMLSVGYYIKRKIPNFEEFLVAGRSMTTPILVCTLASTYYGLDVLFGTSEMAFNNGVVAFFGYSQLSIAVYFFAAFALSDKLRDAEFTSLPEILERHYGRAAGIFGGLASLAYSIPALALFGLGRLCEVVFGIDSRIGALGLGGIALVYTLWGGLWAVAITDTVQFVLMCVTLAIAIPLLMGNIGGFDAVASAIPAGHFAIFGDMPIWLMLAYTATGISILVDPGFYQRIFAAQSARQARNAMLLSMLIWFAYDWLVVAGGMLAAAGVETGILPAGLHSNDALLTAVMFALPAGLAGLFLAGVLATAMSTIDSYSLVAGANLSYDLIRPLKKRPMSDPELVRLTKFGIVLSWTFGYLLAYTFDKLMALWVFQATLLTSTVLVPIFVCLFWKGKKTPAACLLSYVFGLVSVIAFYFTIKHFGESNTVYGTYIWSISLWGSDYEIWQEYSLFFTLPISALGFLIGNCFGSNHTPPAPADARR